MDQEASPRTAALVDALADELTEVRQRGLGRTDEVVGAKPALALPNLEALAAATEHVPGSRSEGISYLLRQGLKSYEDVDVARASLVRQLMFEPNGQPVGQAGRPNKLLTAARKAAGERESTFRVTRKTAMSALAQHLVTVALAEHGALVGQLVNDLADKNTRRTDSAAVADARPEDTRSFGKRKDRVQWIVLTAGFLVVIAAVLGIVALAGVFTDDSAKSPPTGADGPSRREQTGRQGANTFENPYDLSGSSKLESRVVIVVKCRWYHPEPASVRPDGYWYLIASGPQAGRWAPANSFLNGDVYGGPTKHNVDRQVPLCR